MKNFKISRRSFIETAFTAATFSLTGGCLLPKKEFTVDENLSVFLSDMHISGKNIEGQPTYQNKYFEKVISQVLDLNPRPKSAVIFGDLALWNGLTADYEEVQLGVQKLIDAGIEVFVTPGNHDHREEMFKFYPKQKEITPVPGRFVSVINIGTADLVLLDSLNETFEKGKYGNAVAGILDEEQGKWLLEFAATAKRPFFCGSHHPPCELSINGKKLLQHFKGNMNFAGYIHGHNHEWSKAWHATGWGDSHVFRSLCLPSTGWWGYIGFATMRTSEDKAVVNLVQNDFYFPAPMKAGEKRPSEWDQIMREAKADSSCTFFYK